MQPNTGRSTRRSQTSTNGGKSVVKALPDPKPVTRKLSASPVGWKLRSKADEPCNEMKRQLEQQMEQIKAAVGHHSDIEIVPESQHFTTDFTDAKQTALEQKKVMLNDLKALLHQNGNFTDYPKTAPKVAESPALSTVTEESCSKFSKTVTTPTNSQKTHLTSIPENNDDNTDEDVPQDKSPNLESPIISPPDKKNRQRTCSKNIKATDVIDTADIDGDEEEEERKEAIKPKKQRASRSKKRSAKSSPKESRESDSDCEIIDIKPTRSPPKKAETGGCKDDVGNRSTRRSTRSSPRDYKEIDSDCDMEDPTSTQSRKQKNVKGDKGKEGKSAGSKRDSPKSARDKSEDEDVVEVVMDSHVSSSQGFNLTTTFKKPLEKRNSDRKCNANVSKMKKMYSEFGFSSQSDEDNSSQKDERLNDSQDEFIARIERISGKKNAPEKVPKFFKARARERMNSSQGDGSKFVFESNGKETKTKAKPEKKGKGKKPQKPGMNFINYLEFKKPRDRNSSQSPLSEKEETLTYEFPATTGTKVDKRQKGPHKQKAEKDVVVIEYPSDKVKKDQRKGNSLTSEEEQVESVPSADKVPEVEKRRKSLKKKSIADEEDEELGPFDNDSSRHGKKKETEAVKKARQDKKSVQKKSKRADDDDEDWEFPSVSFPTAEKNTSRSRSKKDKECEDWEFPAPLSLSVENDTSRNRSRSKKRETEMLSPDVDSSNAFQNTIAKIKKKIKDTGPKKKEKEEAELSQSQRSRPDYDLASVRDDSSDDEELGGALLHYDSKAESLLTLTSCGPASYPSSSREKTAAAERRRSRKKINYKEASESESDIGSMTSFGPKSSSRASGKKFNLFRRDNQALYTPDDQVITNNPKKMKRNVFSDKTDTQSEVSWLSSTNRKQEKKKPTKTYGQGKKPAKRGKLQPGHSLFFDEESEKENEPKGKGKRGQKKSAGGKQLEKRQRNGHEKRSKSPVPAKPRLYEPNFPTEVVYTPLEPLLIENDTPASPKHADIYNVRTPRYGKGKQFKPLEMMVTPVTPRSAARMEGG
ncbi:microtubule-associated protein futsch-like [Lineus longissimus]|uniref:microtubule-associated protein futsch-like n=1 Tax=Lineus longissimus TaxID=88925 RepID=UPI00315CBF67